MTLEVSYSFVSLAFPSRIEWQLSKLIMPLFVYTLLIDKLETDVNFPFYPVVIEDRELLVDLMLLEVIDFDVILGMDWLAQHYASIDCREKVIILRIPNDEKF